MDDKNEMLIDSIGSDGNAVPSLQNPSEDSQTEPEEMKQGEPDSVKTWKLTLTEEERKIFPISDNALNEFERRAQDLGLTEEQASGLLKYRREQYQAYQREAEAEEAERIRGWRASLAADSEIGGSDRNAREANAAAIRAIDMFGNEELKKMLVETGYEFNPEIRRFLVRVGRALGEAKAVTGKETAPQVRHLADRLYPKM
ncbi:MAG: hypothetical protein PUB69_00375 [Desulfovibrionaceae bacterium]|nr:hypothetical protein [Desulfovibrionaceae bacterium]